MTVHDGAGRTAPRRSDGLNWELNSFQGSAKFISLVSQWWEEFGDAYIEYGPGAADVTGLAGQWADMFRKVLKLKRAFWEGDPSYLKRETEAQILRDLISHAFLALEQLDRGMLGGRTTPPEWHAHTVGPNLGASPSSTVSA